DEGPCVDAWSRMSLEEDDVAVMVFSLAFEEMIEPDLVERGGRCVGRDVSPDAILRLVRFDHHRERVPPHETLDAAFDLPAAWKRRVIGRGNRVDIRSVGGEDWLDAPAVCVIAEFTEQAADARGAA